MAHTLLSARFMLPPSSILSRVTVSNVVLLVPMYPLGCGHSTARLLGTPRATRFLALFPFGSCYFHTLLVRPFLNTPEYYGLC